ncbi:GIN domain-containing protein [Caballeronia sp. 15711]|uniref:GIN domain-containing protein n=1 Tax=Caballeronia sp. 15711 TaxID=3391029 RepID=UPI0039E611E5
MNSEAFLRTLRAGLAGLSKEEVDEIIADYEAHFAEARASGRSEAEVAEALGDPSRLARELRAETGLRRYEAHRSVANLITAMLALAGLAAVDIFFLMPLLLIVAAVALGIGIGLVALGAVGAHMIFTVVFLAHGGSFVGGAVRFVVGIGLIACLVVGGSLLLMGLGAGVRMLGRYMRMHYHLLEPEQDRTRVPGEDGAAQERKPAKKSAVLVVTGLIVVIALGAVLTLGSSLAGSHRAGSASWWSNGGWRCGPTWMNRFDGSSASGRGASSVNAANAAGTSPASVTFPFEANNRIDIELPASVSYQPGPKAEATVTGDPAVVSHVHIADGKLGFDNELGCSQGSQVTPLSVRLKGPPIETWGIIGSSDLALSGIDQQKLQLRIMGSGHVVASGAVQVVALNVAGSGEAELQGLKARSARIVVHGSGEVQVTAQDNADIEMRGSGVVKLHGRPAQLHSNISGSGRIENTP